MASAPPASNSLRTVLLFLLLKMSRAVNTIFLSSFSTMDSMPHFRQVVQSSFDIKHLVSIHGEQRTLHLKVNDAQVCRTNKLPFELDITAYYTLIEIPLLIYKLQEKCLSRNITSHFNFYLVTWKSFSNTNFFLITAIAIVIFIFLIRATCIISQLILACSICLNGVEWFLPLIGHVKCLLHLIHKWLNYYRGEKLGILYKLLTSRPVRNPA
jgi:hypothetical protein